MVLSVNEVRTLLDCLGGRPQLIGQILYGAGLRGIEAVRLRDNDVDFEWKPIMVRDGRGRKGRVTALPEGIQSGLKGDLRRIKQIYSKDLQEGYDIRSVQELLGHKDVNTTMICTHALHRGPQAVRSPLDRRR